jgi:hypothetical protein
MLCDCNIYRNKSQNSYLYCNVILQDTKTHAQSNVISSTHSTPNKQKTLLLQAKLKDFYYYTHVLESVPNNTHHFDGDFSVFITKIRKFL